jgi:hypothetical protein
MPELEPGSGEGQNHINKQMFNERDGRPIKTPTARNAAFPGSMNPVRRRERWLQANGVFHG